MLMIFSAEEGSRAFQLMLMMLPVGLHLSAEQGSGPSDAHDATCGGALFCRRGLTALKLMLMMLPAGLHLSAEQGSGPSS